jgi:alginate O-acetyltransferase complex protein AlgI
MLFQTPEFLVFFVIVVAAVALVRGKARKLVLLIASWIFYGWASPRFLIPLLITTFVDYAIGIALEKHRSKALVAISVAANLTMLALLRVEPGLLHMAVPLGISFYTFHSISYIVDVYRGELPACRSPLDYALFIAFFPELVAGPIVRGKQFLPQLAREVVVRIDEFAVMRVTRGLAKKVLIADNVALFVNAVFADPARWPSVIIWLATIGFAVQIYCDFSGYTDIAIGLAHVFGFELPVNFDRPYFARNPRDFWRRWHISLSSWLRDYLYIPLGGNRKHVVRNIMITMLLGGLWHGASWNFVLWGAMHGVLLIANRLWQRPRSLILTQILILFTWIAFRVREPHAMLTAMRKFVFFDFDFALAGRGLLTIFFFSTIALIVLFIALHASRFDPSRLRTPLFIAACAGIGIAFFFLWPAEQTPFIYFQF